MGKYYLLDEDMELLRKHGKVVSYGKDEVILNEHTSNRKIFWLESGYVRIELSRLYQGIVLSRIGPGEIFGEISFLGVGQGHASATVRANEPVEVLEVDGEEIETVLSQNPELAARLFRTIATLLAYRLRVQSHKN